MTAFLITLVVLLAVIAGAYAVLARGISLPLRPVRRARGRSTSRPRDPRLPHVASHPRRGVLPSVAELASALDSHRWVPDRSTPIAARLSAHAEHPACPWCALCLGDSEQIARVALAVVASALDRSLTDAQMPFVGVDAAVATYARQLADEVQS